MLPKWMNKTAPMEDEPKSAANALQLQEFVSELTASQGRVRAFIVTLMPGSPDVADVVQETNLRLWKSQARYRPGSNFLAWAFTVARLEVLHHRTRAKRKGLIQISDDLLDMLAEKLPDTGDHDAYLDALEGCKSKLTTDGCHMNLLGNIMMAKGVLRGFGLSEEKIAAAEKRWLGE